jgi:hypothetical protein
MILSLVHLVLISVILLAPAFLYKNRSRRMMKFYKRMTYSEYCRRFYAQILLLVLILFHFAYYWMKPGVVTVMISTPLVFYLFSAKRTLDLFKGIRNSRGVMVFLFTIALAMLFIPYMYSLGVSLGYTLLAAVFYPSAKMVGMKDENKEYPTYQELQDDTIQNYYS